jgi:hypothetical protein
VLDDIGLFDRKNLDWKALRQVALANSFSASENFSLQRSLGFSWAHTLGLLLCQNVDEVVRLLTKCLQASYKRSISVEVIFATCLVEHITEAFAGFEGDWDSLGRLWSHVCTALAFASFPSKTEETCCRQVLSSMVDGSSFRERRSFQFYLPVLNSVRPETPVYDALFHIVRGSLILDLRSIEQRPSVDEFMLMLDSKTGEVLSTGEGESCILDFVKSAIIQHASVTERFVVTGRFFEILFTKMYILKNPGRLIPTLIGFVKEHSPSKQALLIAAFQVAKKMPLLFEQCGDDQVRAIVELILPADHGSILLEQPQLIVELLRLDEGHVPGPFYVFLQARAAEVILRKAASSINLACTFYLASRGVSSSPALTAISEQVFLGAFSAWNPSSISTIVDKDELTLASLFRCFDDCPPSVAACRLQVASVVNEWHSAFQDNALTRTQIHDSREACAKEGWQPLGEWAQVKLPNEAMVTEKLDEFDAVVVEIFELLSVRDIELISTPLSILLKGYNCRPAVGSDFDRLLSRYEPFPSPKIPADVTSFIDKRRPELRQLYRDRATAVEFNEQYEDAIHTCDYFLKSPSALFRKSISAFTKNKLEVKELRSALQHTLQDIASLFSPRTTFKDVDAAVKLISTSGGELRQELASLAGCAALRLTEEQQERFKAVALMSRFSGPLDRFVKFCRQFKFAVVNSDPTFKQLEEVAVLLVSEKVVGLDAAECLDFSSRLAGLLCPGIVGDTSIVELRSQVEDTLPCIDTLGVLSIHSEIWTFAREMNWFGREGLKRFYAEYNNCTNVLLGNTASYEMSVLYALQPTIRAVSLIGSLQSETSLGAFLGSLQSSSDIKKCSHGGSSSDLNQVQSNLSQIREWFTNGVDDIAAVYGMFEAVSRSGEYSIQAQQDEKPMLTLAYQHKDEKKWLQGKDLVAFVQHVGLIQHEDERIANEVTCFVELYMLLSKAANNFVEMLNLGFNADFGSFTCCAGSGQLDQARELLRSSDVSTRTYERQVQALRDNYRVSTLFFTEELKEMYDIFTDGGPDSEQWPELVRKISRLLCSSTKLSWEEQCQVCDTVARSMKHARNQNNVGWLHISSKLIENVHGAFGDRAIQYDAKNGRTGRIVLHTLTVDDDRKNWAVFCLFRSIYKVRYASPNRFNSKQFTCHSHVADYPPLRIVYQRTLKCSTRWRAAQLIIFSFSYYGPNCLPPIPLC